MIFHSGHVHCVKRAKTGAVNLPTWRIVFVPTTLPCMPFTVATMSTAATPGHTVGVYRWTVTRQLCLAATTWSYGTLRLATFHHVCGRVRQHGTAATGDLLVQYGVRAQRCICGTAYMARDAASGGMVPIGIVTCADSWRPTSNSTVLEAGGTAAHQEAQRAHLVSGDRNRRVRHVSIVKLRKFKQPTGPAEGSLSDGPLNSKRSSGPQELFSWPV